MTSASPPSRSAPILFAILQILIPMLPQLGLGEPIGERSDNVDTLITPAGWAFSIWSVLYAGSVLFAIYQALPAQRENPLLAQLRWPAAGAFAGNAAWALYTQSEGLSAVSSAIILFTLLCLLVAYRRFAQWPRPFSAGERWFAFVPLSALVSWLTVATLVNVSASLRFHGVEVGDAAPMAAAGVVIVGGVIAALALLRGAGNLPYALVFLWGLAAIFAEGGQTATLVAMATVVAGLLVVAGAILGWRRAEPRSSL